MVRVYLARRSADSSQVEGLKRAIRLVPDNAEFPHLLGLRLSASDQDDDGAIANLRKAVTLNPNSGRYWLDLAAVYQVTGNVEKQNEAVQSALDAEPGNPEVALRKQHNSSWSPATYAVLCRCSGKLSCRTRKLPRPFSRCAGVRRETRICFLLR